LAGSAERAAWSIHLPGPNTGRGGCDASRGRSKFRLHSDPGRDSREPAGAGEYCDPRNAKRLDWMAFTRVQGGANFTGGSGVSTIAVTLGSTVGVGNNICGYFEGALGTGISILSITDDKSNNYTIADQQLDSNNVLRAASFYLANITNSPITITITLSATATFLNIVVDEFAGPVTVPPVHAINSQLNVATTSNAITSGSVTAPSAGSLVFSATGNQGNSNATTGAGFTSGQVSEPAGDDFAYTEYILSRAAGAVAGTFTANATGDNYQTIVMVFAPPTPVLLYGQIWM
jgi:hypothetical protein